MIELTESFDETSYLSISEDESNAIQNYFGLSPRLWRLAIVTGIAQFSVSIWSWQFGIFAAGIVE
jgi:hypothetical protein